jgi:beta-N-acetylhexosaminidase
MKKNKRFVLLSLFLTISAALFSVDFYSEMENEELAEALLQEMTDTQIVGQTFMITYPGDKPDPGFLKWITERHVGGIKIFGWNGNDAIALGQSINTLQKSAESVKLSIPLFIATDQEGGWVRHVRDKTSVTPGNMSLAAGNSLRDCFKTGYYIGMELNILGINMNFAPAVDLMFNPDSKIIGTRAFSSDPILTSEMAQAFYKGQEKCGVISTAKHFPGHGRCIDDSHGRLPKIEVDYQTLLQTDLKPYLMLIKENIPAIMSGHLNYPLVTNNKNPASLSPFLLKDILRKQLNYNGIIITDDLMMHGAQKKGIKEQYIPLEALKSGNDIILMSYNKWIYEQAWTSILAEYRKNPEFKQQIRESAKRIILTKLNYLKRENRVPVYPDIKQIKEKLPLKEAQQFILDQACRSVTILKKGIMPETDKDQKILLAGRYRHFFNTGTKAFPGAGKYFFNMKYSVGAKKQTAAEIAGLCKNYDIIIFEVSDDDMLEIAKMLKKYHEKMIIISTNDVSAIKESKFASTSIAVYSINPVSYRTGFEYLKGNIQGTGKISF